MMGCLLTISFKRAAAKAAALVVLVLAAAPWMAPVSQAEPRGGEAPPSRLSREDVESWLDGLLPYAIQSGQIAGGVVVVVKDGQVLTEKGYGYADVSGKTLMAPATHLVRPGP